MVALDCSRAKHVLQLSWSEVVAGSSSSASHAMHSSEEKESVWERWLTEREGRNLQGREGYEERAHTESDC